MTKPETDFGEALRRALSGAAEVEPGNDALQRIRARASVRTPKTRVAAMLAAVIPWRVYRLLQYRTMVADAARLCGSLVQRHVGRWLDPVARRAGDWSAGSARLLAGWWTRSARLLGEWSAGSARRTTAWSTAARRSLGATGERLESPVHPRHADSGPPPSKIGWARPALAAASVAFVATLAVTVGPVRQAIVQLGSSVISNGHSQSGNGGGTLTGDGKHVSPLSGGSKSAVASSSVSRATPKPSSSRSSCATTASASAVSISPCPAPVTTPASSTATSPSVTPTSPSSTTTTGTSPPASASASASPTPVVSASAGGATEPASQATSTP